MNAVLGGFNTSLTTKYYSTSLFSEVKRVKQIAVTLDWNLAIMFVWQFDSVLLKYPWRTSNCSSALIPRLAFKCPERSHIRVKQQALMVWSAYLLESFKTWFALRELSVWERGTDTIPNLTLEEEGKRKSFRKPSFCLGCGASWVSCLGLPACLLIWGSFWVVDNCIPSVKIKPLSVWPMNPGIPWPTSVTVIAMSALLTKINAQSPLFVLSQLSFEKLSAAFALKITLEVKGPFCFIDYKACMIITGQLLS